MAGLIDTAKLAQNAQGNGEVIQQGGSMQPGTMPAGGMQPGMMQGVAPEMSPGTGGEEQATAEEQQQYDTIIEGVGQALHDNDQTSQSTLNMLQNQNQPMSQNVADVAEVLVVGIDEQMGDSLDGGVMLAAVPEVVSNIIEFAEAAGLPELSQQEVDDALQMTTTAIMEAYDAGEEDFAALSQELTPDQMRQAAQLGG